MITNLLKVTLLTITASSNAVLIAPKNKYITNDQPNFVNVVELDETQFLFDEMNLEQEGTDARDPYTTAVFSQSIVQTTYNNVKVKNLILHAYQTTQSENDASKGVIVGNIQRQPFILNITSYEIMNNDNIVVDIYNKVFHYLGNQTISNYFNVDKKIYVTYDTVMENYMQTLWDYFNKPQNSLKADDPFVYKQNLIGQIQNIATSQFNAAFNHNITVGTEYGFTSFLPSSNNEQTLRTKMYSIQIANYNLEYGGLPPGYEAFLTSDPDKPLFKFSDENDFKVISYSQKGWIIPITNYEVIDVPNIMFTIISMPFTFFSKAFNLTLFPNTPYSVNIGNILLSIIAMLSFIIILKLILKLKG